MGIFIKGRKKQEFDGPKSPASKRAAMLATADLVPWAEACLYQIGRNLSDFRAEQDPYALAEATVASEALQAVIDEINARHGELAVELPEPPS